MEGTVSLIFYFDRRSKKPARFKFSVKDLNFTVFMTKMQSKYFSAKKQKFCKESAFN